MILDLDKKNFGKTIVDRFNDLVDKSGECWEWIGNKNSLGYGMIWYEGKNIRSHRVSYFIKNGEFNDKLFVCHKCDNPKCVNPEHLFLGTSKDNMRDMIKKGRSRSGINSIIKMVCPKGHPYSGDNLQITKRSNGQRIRVCKICQRESHARYFQSKRRSA